MAGQYAKLCSSDDVGKVTKAFVSSIELSFVTNPMPSGFVTDSEIAHRFKLCDRIFTNLRGDLKWSIPKIVDMLPTYLKCELDGVPYNPESVGSSWNPEVIDKQHDVPHLQAVPTIGQDPVGIVDDPAWDDFDPQS